MGSDNLDRNKKGPGFWIRAAACCLDLAAVWGGVTLLVVVARGLDAYVPRELCLLLVAVAYFVGLTAYRGQTLGKLACGLRVVSNHHERLPVSRTLLRETLGKLLSGVPFLFGFLWVGFSKSKRGWHDYVAGTQVTRLPVHRTRRRIASGVGFGIGVYLIGVQIYGIGSARFLSRGMGVQREVKSPYESRDPAFVVDSSSLTEDDYRTLVQWLDERGQRPSAYIVASASKHDLTIIGEGLHGVKPFLDLVNGIIPDLYQKAGVTCIALEACPSFNNRALDRLVTAPEFDEDLALQIARSENWRLYGYKEYWEILRTVWRLNQTLPSGQKRMRVVGLDVEFEMPSWALMGLGDDGLKNTPVWEKLRLLRLVDDVARVAKRDELMAATVEREILVRGERGVVLIGANHAYLRYGWPGRIAHGKAVAEKRRMGYMLHQRHGDRVYQILLYHSQLRHIFPACWEEVMSRRKDSPVGFDVVGSPFENLRSGFPFQASVLFADVTPGVVFLANAGTLEPSERIGDFITREMFLRHKPFYEARAGRRLRNAGDANRHVSNRQ
jgi:uncharacterized RDD family membrane protein YckC